MPRTRPARLSLAVATMLLAVAWVWRFQIAGGYARTFGDRYDAMIEIALLRHWSNVLAGAEAWNVVAWFHPAADTLGYNDGYLALGLLHALGRAIGLSLFGATDFAHAVLKAAGFAGMALLLRRAGGVRFGWALFGATLFTVADLSLQHANHGQLFTLGFAPWAALAAWTTACAIREGLPRRVLTNGIAFVAVFALWISTAYYLAWFFALFALVLAVASVQRGITKPLRAAWKPLALIAIIGIILLAPFLLVYLPKAHETGMHDAGIALHTTLWPIDFVNAGPANLVWGWLPGAIRAHVAPGMTRDPDAIFGMPPLFLATAIAAVLAAQRWPDRRWLGPVGVALLVCWGLMLNVGVMPWLIVQAVVPGAGGIRVVGRFAILLLLPACFLVTVLLDRLRRRSVALALAGMLLVEQVATAAPLALDPAERTHAFAAIPPPPHCAVFAVVRATPPVRRNPALDRLYAPNVDAMVLASLWRRPTINGVSTFGPPGWDFADPLAPDYRAKVQRYAQRFGLHDVCLLDTRQQRPWTKLE